jgi:hypothetical protein
MRCGGDSATQISNVIMMARMRIQDCGIVVSCFSLFLRVDKHAQAVRQMTSPCFQIVMECGAFVRH